MLRMANFNGIRLQLPLLMIVELVIGLGPLVQTKVGLIRGLRATDGNYSMFLGIPYAECDPDNYFGPSKPYPAFKETFEAYDDSAICPQFDSFIDGGMGSINCLHLNVHVPNSATSENPLPVMFSIHGGAFFAGLGGRYSFGSKFLVKHDVILVTFNYRLGVYGFMCLGTPEVPGNQGLKDQIIALRWVKANIKAFGGDPDRVTILGQSAGGRSVDFLLMSNYENLFNKAILQSGNSLSPPGIGEVSTDLPILLAKRLGFATNDFTRALKFLKTVDSNLLVTAAEKIGWTFQACVEKQLDGVDRFIPDFTINRNVTRINIVPVLIGFDVNERYYAHIFKNNYYYKNLDIFRDYLKHYFTFDKEMLEDMSKLVRKFYIGDREMNVDVKQEISDFDSDFKYIHPTHRRIEDFLSNGAKNVYYYMFSYHGERNLFRKQRNLTVTGAIHSDEMAYLYDQKVLNKTPTPEDQMMIDRMTTMWTNFAKYGDPTPETSDLLPVKWKPVSQTNMYYFNIDSELTLKRRPLNRRMAFLDLFFKMNEKFQIGFRKIN